MSTDKTGSQLLFGMNYFIKVLFLKFQGPPGAPGPVGATGPSGPMVSK